MHVRHVRVGMALWHVLVSMCVWFARRITSFVAVTMMDVMHVRMRMCHLLVRMGMLMMFAQMQPDADSHQHTRRRQLAPSVIPNEIVAPLTVPGAGLEPARLWGRRF